MRQKSRTFYGPANYFANFAAMSPARIHTLLLGSWVLLNLLQAAFTGLANDEAYYWLYGEHLSWGYFHQPPVIGFAIKLGTFLAPGELGVRLLPVLMNGVAMHLIWRMTDRKQPILFWAIVGGTFLAHVAGFLAVPDSPLIFFSVIFLSLLKRYQEEDGWLLALAMGAAAGFLLLGKYHGILVLGFALLANLKLLRRPSFYAIPVIGALILLPHLLWQVANDFPGFGFHLAGRFTSTLDLQYMLDYPLGQLLMAGPLVGLITWPAALLIKNKSPFERTLYVILVGELIWFLLWAIKGRIEPNWTAGAFIALFILSYRVLSAHLRLKRVVYAFSAISVLGFLVLRANLAFPFLDQEIALEKFSEFNGWEAVVHEVDSLAGDRNLATNSYQQASQLWYYGQRPVASFNIHRSGNEFDLWRVDADWFETDIAYLHDDVRMANSTPIILPAGDTTWLSYLDHFPIWREVKVAGPSDTIYLKAGELTEINLDIDNPCPKALQTVHGEQWRTVMGHHLYKDEEIVAWHGGDRDIKQPISGEGSMAYAFTAPAEAGIYQVEFALITANFSWWSESRPVVIRVIP